MWFGQTWHLQSRASERAREAEHGPVIPASHLTFMGWSCTRVMREGSTTGLGRRSVSRMFCHCGGRPTNLPSLGSKEVWTRCWKFCGAEISGRFFFFLRNMVSAWEGQAELQRGLHRSLAQGAQVAVMGAEAPGSGLPPTSTAPMCWAQGVPPICPASGKWLVPSRAVSETTKAPYISQHRL